MCEEDEEGIGTMLTVNHKSPAFIGEEVSISATGEKITGHELICSYEASVDGQGDRDGSDRSEDIQEGTDR
jgi:predicted thioesterase